MSGHHPISKLFEKLTPEDRQRIKAMTAELIADIERREALEAQTAQEDLDELKQPQPAK